MKSKIWLVLLMLSSSIFAQPQPTKFFNWYIDTIGIGKIRIKESTYYTTFKYNIIEPTNGANVSPFYIKIGRAHV